MTSHRNDVRLLFRRILYIFLVSHSHFPRIYPTSEIMIVINKCLPVWQPKRTHIWNPFTLFIRALWINHINLYLIFNCFMVHLISKYSTDRKKDLSFPLLVLRKAYSVAQLSFRYIAYSCRKAYCLDACRHHHFYHRFNGHIFNHEKDSTLAIWFHLKNKNIYICISFFCFK